MERIICMHSIVGAVRVTERDGAIVRLAFGADTQAQDDSDLLREAVRQLQAYFAGRLQRFDLPLAPEGTSFQQQVWRELSAIPYGQTRSYLQIAQAIGRGKACRAVGRANHLNPIPLIIPCHRVIGADGSPGGYAGGADIKRTLLRLEGIRIYRERI